MLRKAKISTLVLVLALTSLLAACGSSGTSSESNSNSSSSNSNDSGSSNEKTEKIAEVKIGHIHPMSGALAEEGQDMANAIKLAVDEVNANGGIKSLDGAKVLLLEGDHEGKPEKGVSETQRLIREGAIGVLGAYASGVALTATQVAEKEKTPFIITIGAADEITERGFKFTYRLQPPASMMAKDFIRYVKDLNDTTGANLTTVAIAHEDSVFGTSIVNYIAQHASEAGLQIVATISHSAGASDFSSSVNKIRSIDPDILVLTTYLRDGSMIVKGLAQAKYQPRAIIGVANGAFSNAGFIKEETAVNQYIMDVNYTINPKSDLAQNVKKTYRDNYGKGMSPNAAYSYQAAKVLMDAIERVGSTDREKVNEALKNTNYTEHVFPQGAIQFDETGQNINAQAVLNQLVDGQTLVTFPEDYKETDSIYPMPDK